MERLEVLAQLTEMKNSPYILDLSQPVLDRDGIAIKDGVVQFRQLSAAERQQLELDANSAAVLDGSSCEATPMTSPLMPETSPEPLPPFTIGSDSEAEDALSDTDGPLGEGESASTPVMRNNRRQYAQGRVFDRMLSMTHHDSGKNLRRTSRKFESPRNVPLYAIEVSPLVTYQAKLIGSNTRKDMLIAWTNGKLAEVRIACGSAARALPHDCPTKGTICAASSTSPAPLSCMAVA